MRTSFTLAGVDAIVSWIPGLSRAFGNLRYARPLCPSAVPSNALNRITAKAVDCLCATNLTNLLQLYDKSNDCIWLTSRTEGTPGAILSTPADQFITRTTTTTRILVAF